MLNIQPLTRYCNVVLSFLADDCVFVQVAERQPANTTASLCLHDSSSMHKHGSQFLKLRQLAPLPLAELAAHESSHEVMQEWPMNKVTFIGTIHFNVWKEPVLSGRAPAWWRYGAPPTHVPQTKQPAKTWQPPSGAHATGIWRRLCRHQKAAI